MTHAAPPELPCQEFIERVTDYLEGALSADDRSRLEVHLGVCRHCALYLDQIRATLTLTGELREADVTPAMRDELIAVFAAWRAGDPAPDGSD